MAKFKITETSLNGLVVIEPEAFCDVRGRFMETFNEEEFHKAGLPARFVQDNESRSAHGVLRGLHYQARYPQGKLVRVSYGAVYDVCVDIRPGSLSFGKYESFILSSENRKMLYVPEGFAHGFLALTEPAVFAYKCTQAYHPEFDAGIIYNDKDIGIAWPMDSIILSDKDAKLPALKDAAGFEEAVL